MYDTKQNARKTPSEQRECRGHIRFYLDFDLETGKNRYVQLEAWKLMTVKCP